MQLKCFRSLWGCPSARALGAANPAAFSEKLLSRLRLQNFDGLEASLADLEALGGVRHVKNQLTERNMELVAGVYSGWVDYEDAALSQQFEDVETQFDRLHRQLEAAMEADPVVINVHAGSDRWSRGQQLEFLARALELGQRLGCDDKLAFETHRGRMFYSPWPTLELLEALPSLQLTLDFSHWVVVAERLLDTPEDQEWLLEKVVPHVRHVHGRVGSVQRAQLDHPENKELSEVETERFQRLWNDVWRAQMREFQAETANGDSPRQFATFTPEYGPIPYAPRSQVDTSVEAYNVDALCAAKAEEQRQIFASLL